MTKYPAKIETLQGVGRLDGQVEFTDPNNQPLATAGGIIPSAVDIKTASLPVDGAGMLDVHNGNNTDLFSVASDGTIIINFDAASGAFQIGGTTKTVLLIGNDGSIATAPPAPATQQLVSGAGHQLGGADSRSFTPVTFNPTAGAAATCAIAISPDNVVYTALGTETIPPGVALDGTIRVIPVFVPFAWYLKMTVVNAVLGLTTFY